MNPEWEIEYLNWLSNEQYEDTPDRREAFRTGWEWSRESIKARIERI